jgi:3-dehydroquinate synthase
LELELSYQLLAKLPRVADTKSSLLIYDSILQNKLVLKKWIASFPNRYAVKSGETLKEVQRLPKHLSEILKIQQKSQITFTKIYVLGGGSVGDFGGFVASILKRGIPVVQIPSTWLAAVDSAHGGKTALNVAGFKNQVGTFHYPEKVWVVKQVLETQPPARLKDAAGEFIKTALIGGGDLVRRLDKWNWEKGQIRWPDLSKFIDVKYKILKNDPFEKKGIRHLLNFGHTLGHAFEAAYGIPHGLAVYYGMLFALVWSSHRSLLKSKTFDRLLGLEPWDLLLDHELDRKLFRMKKKELAQYLLQDKKNTKKGIRYVFMRSPGKMEIQTVQIEDVLKEYERQKDLLENLSEIF